jgi:hypothetical protein
VRGDSYLILGEIGDRVLGCGGRSLVDLGALVAKEVINGCKAYPVKIYGD